jgi:nicotinamidase-related amidase
MKRPALIVIDMLRDFLDGWPTNARERLVRSTQTLVSSMREHGCPVIWVRQKFEPDLSDAFLEMKAKGKPVTIMGTPSDVVIVKKRYSVFFGTDLERILANLKPDAIILAGINTHACVRMTAIDAYQRDWLVVLASECIGSYDEEHHAVTLRYLRGKIAAVMTNDEIRARIGR